MPNITIHLDDETHRLAKVYAAEHGTSVSEMFRSHIRTVANPAGDAGVLQRYARGELPARDTMSALGLQTREDLYVAALAAGFGLPRTDQGATEKQQVSIAAKILESTHPHA